MCERVWACWDMLVCMPRSMPAPECPAPALLYAPHPCAACHGAGPAVRTCCVSCCLLRYVYVYASALCAGLLG